MSETLSPMTELELEVVPQLVLENKDGKILVSISCQEDGATVGKKNKVKRDKVASIAMAKHPEMRGRKFKIVAVDEGSATCLPLLFREEMTD